MRAFLVILLFSWLITLFLPWWGIVIPGLIFGAILFQSGTTAFFTGFSATGLAWFLQALYIDLSNESILSNRIAEMMGVGSHWLILLITFLVAACTGGLAALVGYFITAVFRPAGRNTAIQDFQHPG